MNKLRPELAQRRERVAEMLLSGSTIRQIAADTGVAIATAFKDARVVRSEWQARRVHLMDQRGSEDLARTEAALKAIWPKVLVGDPVAIDKLLGLLRYRADVLGLNANTKIDIEVHVREMAEREGLDSDEVLREVQRILRVGVA